MEAIDVAAVTAAIVELGVVPSEREAAN
jgi:hypothetical protein